VVSEVRDRALVEKTNKAQERRDDRQTLLLFASQSGRMAIPLSMVARLEEFQKDAIERAGDQDVVQYRDQILPLIHLSQVLLKGRPAGLEKGDKEGDRIQVVVYSDRRRSSSFGLVVDHILDIVEETIKVQLPASRPGILSSAVIQGRVTELLDIEGVIRAASPGTLERLGLPTPKETRRMQRDELSLDDIALLERERVAHIQEART
jgi:two-component system chemotaxis sensor kinase CheA